MNEIKKQVWEGIKAAKKSKTEKGTAAVEKKEVEKTEKSEK